MYYSPEYLDPEVMRRFWAIIREKYRVPVGDVFREAWSRIKGGGRKRARKRVPSYIPQYVDPETARAVMRTFWDILRREYGVDPAAVMQEAMRTYSRPPRRRKR